MEMESQNFGHMHPMVFKEEQSNETKKANCSRCGEVVSGPSFSCAECGFSLHKQCAEAPSKIDHPFHRNHPLVLLPKPPYSGSEICTCDFCRETCEFFVYHCACKLDFHIKCALFTLNIAEKKLGELEHIATQDPSIFPEDGNKELENANCFGCWVPLGETTYFSRDCGFNLHKKCAELPHEVNHPFHKEHPLILQFNADRFSCNLCKKTQRSGFIYCCSPCQFILHIKCAELPLEINLPCHRRHPLTLQCSSENLPCKTCQETPNKEFLYYCFLCKFALHIECASPPPTIKEKNHKHPFTLFWRQASFICDACGLEGNYVAYICSTCNLALHQKCISLSPIIEVLRHHHPIFHNYFISENEFKIWDCDFCDTEVNIDYGSYYCSDCNFIAHVKCATEKEGWYHIIEAKDKDEKRDDDLALFSKIPINPITCVIEQNEGGEMTRIKHFSHAHHLICANIMVNDKICDGCVLLISNSFYYCSSQCDFFLHKACAELLRRRTQIWFHRCLRPAILVVGYIFKCRFCFYVGTGFSYKCSGCNDHFCLRCAASHYRLKHQGHKHLLFFNRNYRGRCNACGKKKSALFICKHCNFNLDITCFTLPLTTQHKCDEHPLTLTYHEGNGYSEYHYCDICEKRRDPSLWFYHCATCDFSAHPKCVLGRHQLIKPGSTYKGKDHPHPLTFVQRAYDYPARCRKCNEPCQDLALECAAESTCNYVVHWECVKPPDFSPRNPVALYKTPTDVIAHDG